MAERGFLSHAGYTAPSMAASGSPLFLFMTLHPQFRSGDPNKLTDPLGVNSGLSRGPYEQGLWLVLSSG